METKLELGQELEFLEDGEPTGITCTVTKTVKRKPSGYYVSARIKDPEYYGMQICGFDWEFRQLPNLHK